MNIWMMVKLKPNAEWVNSLIFPVFLSLYLFRAILLVSFRGILLVGIFVSYIFLIEIWIPILFLFPWMWIIDISWFSIDSLDQTRIQFVCFVLEFMLASCACVESLLNWYFSKIAQIHLLLLLFVYFLQNHHVCADLPLFSRFSAAIVISLSYV